MEKLHQIFFFSFFTKSSINWVLRNKTRHIHKSNGMFKKPAAPSFFDTDCQYALFLLVSLEPLLWSRESEQSETVQGKQNARNNFGVINAYSYTVTERRPHLNYILCWVAWGQEGRQQTGSALLALGSVLKRSMFALCNLTLLYTQRQQEDNPFVHY